MTDEENGELLAGVSDLMVVEEGPDQFDVQPWMLEFGSIRTGFEFSRNHVKLQVLNELLTSKTYTETCPRPTLAIATRPRDKIRAFVFEKVQLQSIDFDCAFAFHYSTIEFHVAGPSRQLIQI